MALEGDGSDEADGRLVVPLHRGLEMLRCFRPTDLALGNQDLAARTGLPNSTVSRLTYSLSLLGYLQYRHDIAKYSLGLAAFGLGSAYLAGIEARHRALPLMEELARLAGGNGVVGLGGRDGFKMVYVACARGAGAVSLQLDVGSRLSLARSGMGRAYLAGLDEAARAPVLAELATRAGPDRWPTLADGIQRAADQVARRGFCLNVGEWVADVSSVAVPLPPLAGSGDPPLALNYGGPSYLLPAGILEAEIGPRLVELAHRLADDP
jgi:DNA-binding IclR family transcriptional regulator